jgi:ABC-2 type transport system permease protein
MLYSVFATTVRERRWGILGWAVGGLAMAGFIVAIYPVVRDNAGFAEIIDQLPDELLSLIGMDPGVFTTGFGYLQAEMYTLIGPLLTLVLTIGMGASSTAVDESSGTADLLLTTPTTRTSVVAQKSLALAAVTTVLILSFVTVLLIGQVTVDLRLSLWGIGGANLGLFLLGMFFGTMAIGVAAWTGKKNLAIAVAGGIAGLTFFLDGMAPFVESLERLQAFMPFHWYLADDPLLNGPTSWQLLLAGGTVLFVVLAIAGFSRRDIGVFSTFRLSRRRSVDDSSVNSSASPLLRSTTGKAVWDRRRSFWWWLLGIGLLVAMTAAFFPLLEGVGGEAFQELLDAYPPEMLAMFGITDPNTVFTGAGFLSTRVYSTMGVVIALAFAIGIGTASLAGEERRGTADLLMATPNSRDRVVLAKAAAMLILLTALLTGVAFVVWLSDLAVGLDLTMEGIIAANLGLMLLAFVVGAVALAVGAWSGNPGRSTASAVAFAVVAFLLNSFGAVIDWLEPLRPLSPFYWYQGDTNPLNQDLGWQQPLLLAVGLTLVAVAVPLFRRRDIGT